MRNSKCLLLLFLIWLFVAMFISNWSSLPQVRNLRCVRFLHWCYAKLFTVKFLSAIMRRETFLTTCYTHHKIICSSQHFGWFHFAFIFRFLIYINPFDFTSLWRLYFFIIEQQWNSWMHLLSFLVAVSANNY